MTREAWLSAVHAEMETRFGLNAEDLGWDEEIIARYFAYGETPNEFAGWYARKYDLVDPHAGWPVPQPNEVSRHR